jgi:murein DD-endopeptidase MepM/ murein hydrolase activator NlpD
MHWGTDFEIASKTPLVAAANGVIKKAGFSTTYGNRIILEHDNGASTLYAHLDTILVQEGTDSNPSRVIAGQRIALSDGELGNPGRGSSTGAHLHFEYIRKGNIVRNPARINPDACIGNIVNGSIRVFDNGAASDDAFRVTLNGIILGETAIGRSNNFAANNLKPGRYTLVLTTIVAPDNLGTFQIELSNGILFSDGTSSKQGDTDAGESVTFTIIVP